MLLICSRSDRTSSSGMPPMTAQRRRRDPRRSRLKVTHLQDRLRRVQHFVVPEEVNRDRCVILGDGSLMRHFPHLLAQIHFYGGRSREPERRCQVLWLPRFFKPKHNQALVFRHNPNGIG